MGKGIAWNREETIIVMNLYCRIPFGRQHSKDPDVKKLAEALGHSSGSIAMKLNNFTSLDKEEKARGVKGLDRASKLDRQIWAEFESNWEKLADESEKLWMAKMGAELEPIPDTVKELIEPFGPTEGERVMKFRRTQSFFRKAVLAAYGNKCCISNMPITKLLIASHILPWNKFPKERLNPRNGLCLSRIHDAAFDQGLITIDQQNRLILSRQLKAFLPNEAVNQVFLQFEGKPIRLPEKFLPNRDHFAYHRENIFAG